MTTDSNTNDDDERAFSNWGWPAHPPKPVCECGAHKVNSKIHSSWCPLVKENRKPEESK